jgi:isopentenyl-diphosphate delta-isomerase
LGISGLRLIHRDQIEYRADVGNGLIEHELVEIFTAEAIALTSIHPNPTEVIDTSWVDMDDLAKQTREEPEKFTPWLRIYLAEHRDSIFSR